MLANLLFLYPQTAVASTVRTQHTYSNNIAYAYASPITHVNAPKSIESNLDANERYILLKESGLNPRAKNPRSTAFGVGQLLIGNRKHYGSLLQIDPETRDKEKQIQLFRAYVKDRYGTSKKAAEHSRRLGWY